MSLNLNVLKKITLALVVLAHFQSAFAQQAKLAFTDVKSLKDALSTGKVGQATIYLKDMPYLDWSTKEAGTVFPMEVAPVFKGLATGGVNLGVPTKENPAAYKDQLADFAEMINKHNEGGRNTVSPRSDAAAKTPAEQLLNEEKETYVVQTVLSTLIDRPATTLNVNAEKFAAITKAVDDDHSHFTIPGSMALNALEQNHVAARSIKSNQNYLLSVIDFRDYDCAFLKNSIRDYFNSKSEKQKLHKESIYMVSDLEVSKAVAGNVQPKDIAAIEKLTGKRPELVMSQTILYADHLIRGARNVFAFFAEGNQTRIVLISNLAMGKKFFVGTLGSNIRTKIMEGVGSKTAMALNAVVSPRETIDDIFNKSKADMAKKNACNLGLAQGLPAYSKQMFGKFAEYMSKN